MTSRRLIAQATAITLALAPAAGLAQTRISGLPAASPVSSSDVFPATQGSCSSSCATAGVTAAQLKTFTSASPTLVTPTLGVATATSLAGSAAVTSITAGSVSQIGTGGAVVCATGHVCDNLSGEVTVTTGTGTLTAGVIYTVNFSITRANSPNCLTTNWSTATVGTSSNAATRATTASTLVVGGTLAASTTYTADYICAGN